jgi:glycosyltransferase involved in cell wall biosynthesis
MDKIKVLQMIDKPFLGGGQKNLLSIAKFLDKSRFDVSICSQPGGPLVDETRENNIPHLPVNLTKKISPKTTGEIRSLFRDARFDILHTHGGVAGLYGRWAAKKSIIPVVIHTLHGIHYLNYRNPLLRYFYVGLERYFSRFTSALIFVSDADRKKGEKYKLASPQKMHIIKNGIDFSLYTPEKDAALGKSIGIDRASPVIGTVARLQHPKGIRYLVQAIPKIHRAFPSAKIVIIGDGPERDDLERLDRSLNPQNLVLFLGNRVDAPRILSYFDVFVLPSLWEGLPFALLEAAALAKPVVSTTVDGIKELVKNKESGLLVPPKDPDSLGEAVIQLLRDKEYASRLGGNLKNHIQPRYTLSRMVSQTEELYTNLYKDVTP